jgi:hypothetical protein
MHVIHNNGTTPIPTFRAKKEACDGESRSRFVAENLARDLLPDFPPK